MLLLQLSVFGGLGYYAVGDLTRIRANMPMFWILTLVHLAFSALLVYELSDVIYGVSQKSANVYVAALFWNFAMLIVGGRAYIDNDRCFGEVQTLVNEASEFAQDFADANARLSLIKQSVCSGARSLSKKRYHNVDFWSRVREELAGRWGAGVS